LNVFVFQRFIDGHIDRDVVRLDEENFDSSVASGHWMVQLCVVATRSTMCGIIFKSLTSASSSAMPPSKRASTAVTLGMSGPISRLWR
jgi:hypothetical protein